MQRFRYSAFDESGNKQSGEIEATSSHDATQKIMLMQLQPVEVKPLTKGLRLLPQKKPGLAELEYFTKEMAMLLESGIRIDRAIGIIAKNHSNAIFSALLTDIHKEIKQGVSLHKALEADTALFSPLYINMVSIGEASGNLPNVFIALAEDLSFKSAVRSKMIQALTYPLVILVVCLLCLYFVFSFIVPQMSGIFANVATLPWYTELILGVSDWLIANEAVFFGGILLAAGVSVWLHQKGELAGLVQPLQLKLPIIKTLTTLLESMRFNSSMALMLNSGVRLDSALTLAVGSVKHPVFKNDLQQASEVIRKGGPLAQTLSKTQIYDDVYKSLLEVGEESGRLDKTFVEIAGRQKRAFEQWTAKMTALLEPLLIVFMGLIVGGVVVVMLMSMVTVNDVSF